MVVSPRNENFEDTRSYVFTRRHPTASNLRKVMLLSEVIAVEVFNTPLRHRALVINYMEGIFKGVTNGSI